MFYIVLEIGILRDKMWLQDISLHFAKSKWSQFQILNSSKGIAPFLPPTQLAIPHVCMEFLEKYNDIILKPCHGQWGLGVVKVSKIDQEGFQIHQEQEKIFFTSKEELLNYLQTQFFSNDTYIIQKYIPLAEVDHSIFDIRVMVQRSDLGAEWEISAKVVKIASKNFIVTNVAKSLLLLEEALLISSLPTSSIQDITPKVDEVCLLTAKHLTEYYHDIMVIGMDVGLDFKGGVWIIETNFVPDISLFRRLRDKSIYEKIKNKWKK